MFPLVKKKVEKFWHRAQLRTAVPRPAPRAKRIKKVCFSKRSRNRTDLREAAGSALKTGRKQEASVARGLVRSGSGSPWVLWLPRRVGEPLPSGEGFHAARYLTGGLLPALPALTTRSRARKWCVISERAGTRTETFPYFCIPFQ